ncbi:MAG TPA: gluconate 2-dehydrogenase subunit 3 family protein [Bryobacteraceae bacterium]|nr:gluconate 2-dehydrogenase subunit 3 family protein [Bryobacteraceae bacterium]
MASYSSDRRSVLKIFGAIGATCAYPFASDELYGQTSSGVHEHSPASAKAPLHFFNESDFATISRIADLIIPETGTPGAVGAGVPAYIDLVIARNTDQQLVVADGLRWLDSEAERAAGKKFVGLTEEQQLSILEPLCAAMDENKNNPARNIQFFSLIKSLTADGYYTSQVGLMEELGYKGNMALAAYPECVHEH